MYFHLIKKLVELSQFEQISISVWQCDCASIEKGQNPMFQLIDDVLAKVAIRSSIPRQRCRLRKKLEKKVLLYIKKMYLAFLRKQVRPLRFMAILVPK